jgi:hypothetical protein
LFSGQNIPDRTPTLPADSETVEELVPQTLTLGNSGKTTVLNLLGVHLERVFGEAETLLNESGKLADPTTLLTQDFLGVGSTNDDLANHNIFRVSQELLNHCTHLSTSVGHSDITTRVSLLGEFTGKEIIELSAENTVGDEFSPLADLGGHFGKGWIC